MFDGLKEVGGMDNLGFCGDSEKEVDVLGGKNGRESNLMVWCEGCLPKRGNSMNVAS